MPKRALIRTALGFGLLLVQSQASAKDVAGNYKNLAECVYRSLDKERSGLFGMADLGDDIEVSQDMVVRDGWYLALQIFSASFRRSGEDSTSVIVTGIYPTSYFAQQIMPLAARCRLSTVKD